MDEHLGADVSNLFAFFRGGENRPSLRETSPSAVVLWLRWVVSPVMATLGVVQSWPGDVQTNVSAEAFHLMLLDSAGWGIAATVGIWLMLTWTGRMSQFFEGSVLSWQQWRAFKRITGVAKESSDLETILQTSLHEIMTLTGYQAGSIRLTVGADLAMQIHSGFSSKFVESEQSIRLGHCLCGQCAQTGLPCSVSGLAREPELSGNLCAQEGFQTAVGIPLKASGQVVGMLHIADRQPRVVLGSELEGLEAICNVVAAAVHRAHLQEEARHSRNMEAASLIGQHLTSILDIEPLLTEAVRLIRSKFGHYQTRILLADGATGDLVLRAASGPGAEGLNQQKLRFKIGVEGICGRVAYTGQTQLSSDVSRNPQYACVDGLSEIRSELAVPLRAGKRILGVLDVQSERCGAFDKQDIDVLQVLGNQLGTAIENARLFQETRRRYKTMVALHETTLDVISRPDMDKLLGDLLSRGAKLLDAQSGAIFRYDAARDLIYNIATYNLGQDWTGLELKEGEGIIGRIIMENHPFLINDSDSWARQSETRLDLPYTVVLGAPLRWRDQVIGGIMMFDERQPRPFDRNDLWLLQLFADLATIAIKNAELHAQRVALAAELEQRVQDRTRDLVEAKEELANQARLLRTLLLHTTRVQEEERARIAYDMHNGVVQLITAARYALRTVQVASDSESTDSLPEKLDSAREVLNEIEQEIRHVIFNLAPPALNAAGLSAALTTYARDLQEVSGIAIEVEVSSEGHCLSEIVERVVFRMVEEALHNVVSHSGADKASVTLNYQPAELRLTVSDNGRGFDYTQWAKGQNGKHFGLLGMQERARGLGGEMTVSSESGQGTQLLFRVPLEQPGDQNPTRMN